MTTSELKAGEQPETVTQAGLDLRIAEEIGAQPGQVRAAVALLDEGATVPFIARYRKEVTGGLDDTQLRNLEERLRYLRELEERRAAVLASIAEQGKLTPALEALVRAADTKTRLEDLYLPYKKKRRTKAQIAREAGLEPLADTLFDDPTQDPATVAAGFVDAEKGIDDADKALEGARSILVERFAEDAELIGKLRDRLQASAVLRSRVAKGKEAEGAKYSDWFEYGESLARVPSHRALALFRGRKEGVLQVQLIAVPDEKGNETREPGVYENLVASHFGVADRGRAADPWLLETVRHSWRFKTLVHLELELLSKLREEAEEEAIRVFGANLRDLLLLAPAGRRATIGLDPGLRTGVKVAVIDDTGKVVDHGGIFPHAPRNQWDASIEALARLCDKHGASLISIGNGTASRETDRLVADLMKRRPDLGIQKVVVSESGASVYSASELAAKEFPDMDVSYRGAVSIARRLQDPLAELVKIDPKSIGVGQYQHDVNQTRLLRALDAVVEDCVNAVGVDLNTASAPLLTRVSGLNKTHAEKIVEYRDQNGAFDARKGLLKVPRLGEKTFEQAAGFLRIRGGTNPLDQSAVHPEAYPVVERILAASGRDIASVIGDRTFLGELEAASFTDERFGLPTVEDILQELEKPGRDPRPEFQVAEFREGVEEISDLKPDMVLEGTVTNVTNFGAFVDVGVHQDGLVHISAMSTEYVRDPHDVVKAGDIVRVKVMEVDLARKRIAMTMRLDDPRPDPSSTASGGRGPRSKGSSSKGAGRSAARATESRSGGSRPERSRPERSGPTAMSRLLDEALEKSTSSRGKKGK